MRVPSKDKRLSREFYDGSTEQIARLLLGKVLLRRIGRQIVGGVIVETEAYLSKNDPASHSARGQTRSNAAMFGPAGTLYVYPIHAKYCMNVVTSPVGQGSAVLIRAIEPMWGLAGMRERRDTDDERRLTRGPAMLCQALMVDRRQDRIDLLISDEVSITAGPEFEFHVGVSGRIGISSAVDRPLRFFIDGNRFVSGLARDHRQKPSARVAEASDIRSQRDAANRQ